MNPKTATIAAADSSTHRERKSFLFFYRGCRFCLASRDGQATTGQIAEWCRPHLLERGQGFKIKYSSFVIIRRAGSGHAAAPPSEAKKSAVKNPISDGFELGG
jgi:hypothetical protein